MRRSLKGLDPRYIKQDSTYKGLPEELKEFAYHIADCGHSIMAIPEMLLERASKGDMDLFEVPVPTRYVLTRGYRMVNGHVVIEAKYDKNIGLCVDDEYYEY